MDLNGEIVGRHRGKLARRFMDITGSSFKHFTFLTSGHHLYTIGQRARIGGREKRLFVSAKDPGSNEVTVAEGTDHPALFSHSFTTLAPHWITQDPFTGSCDQGEKSRGDHVTAVNCMMRYTHLQPLMRCTVQQIKK